MHSATLFAGRNQECRRKVFKSALNHVQFQPCTLLVRNSFDHTEEVADKCVGIGFLKGFAFLVLTIGNKSEVSFDIGPM